jgi:hypothetical protein
MLQNVILTLKKILLDIIKTSIMTALFFEIKTHIYLNLDLIPNLIT